MVATKRCCRCKLDKTEEEFAPSFWNRSTKNGLWCKACHSAYHKERRNDPGYLAAQIARQKRLRTQKRLDLDAFKSVRGCKYCGETHPGCLDFHHPDPDGKEATLSFLAGSNASGQRLMEEVEKCEVICANCHRIEHWEQRQGEDSPFKRYYSEKRNTGGAYADRERKKNGSLTHRGATRQKRRRPPKA